jgi:hypothetical protein
LQNCLFKIFWQNYVLVEHNNFWSTNFILICNIMYTVRIKIYVKSKSKFLIFQETLFVYNMKY